MTDLSEKVALVTGASRGIGLAIAQSLASRGVRVGLAAPLLSRVERHARELGEDRAIAIQCDVADFSSVSAAVAKCVEKFGALDILVNNAGVIEPIALLADSDPELWARAVDVNYKGVYHGLRAALPIMQSQGQGTVINISSGAANSALEGWSHYCSTKAAAKKLTECAHKEVGAEGIRVIGLSPGTVATDMMAKVRDSQINPVSKLDWSSHIPAEWVGRAVAFLCGPGGDDFLGTDFSIKTAEGRALVGLPKSTA